MITPVPSADAVSVWPRIGEHVKRAVERIDTGFTEEDILTAVQMQRMQLWVVNDDQAAVVTQIQVYPRHKALVFVAVGGSGMDEWLDEMLDVTENYGREVGCRYCETFGRAGWERAVAHRDWRKIYTVLRKEIDG